MYTVHRRHKKYKRELIFTEGGGSPKTRIKKIAKIVSDKNRRYERNKFWLEKKIILKRMKTSFENYS